MAVLKYEEVSLPINIATSPNSSIVSTHVLDGDYIFLRKRDMA